MIRSEVLRVKLSTVFTFDIQSSSASSYDTVRASTSTDSQQRSGYNITPASLAEQVLEIHSNTCKYNELHDHSCFCQESRTSLSEGIPPSTSLDLQFTSDIQVCAIEISNFSYFLCFTIYDHCFPRNPLKKDQRTLCRIRLLKFGSKYINQMPFS